MPDGYPDDEIETQRELERMFRAIPGTSMRRTPEQEQAWAEQQAAQIAGAVGEVLGARNPTTIRELLEDAASYKAFAGRPLILAALDQLTQIEEHAKAIRRITDDKHNVSAGAFHSICHNLDAIRLTLGSLPDPGVGAEHARENA